MKNPPSRTETWSRTASLFTVSWLLGISAATIVANAQVPVDPPAEIKYCRAGSMCGYVECHGDDCQCCYRTGGDYECVDGSCVA